MARAGVVLVLAVLALIAVVHGGGAATTARTGPARILVAMPWNNYSHMQVVYPVVRALCARGHEVVLLSRVPMPPPLPANFKFVQLDFNSPAQQYGFEIGRLQQISAPFRDAYNILALGLDHCQLLLGQEPVQRLLRGGPGGAPAERFDLVITELFFTDCYVALAHRLGAPHLFVNSGPLPPWGYARFGVPSNPAHVAAFSLPVTDDMPFAARLQNAALWAANAALYHLWFAPREQACVDALVPAGTPPLARLLPDAAMLLLNTHPALSPARPLPPNVVEVGGLHIAPEQALPQDLEQFVSGAKDGVILFSLGSMIRASSLPKESAAALLRGFGTLKQRVVWKWEDEAPGPVPDNVRLSKWLPQFDVLCHNNTRLFIGHGGLLSTSEAAHCGVPLLGIAMYGDQRTNLAAVAKAGAGRSLPYSTLKNADLFLKNVKDLLEDPSFQQSATALSERFRDRPMSPLDTAVYWTEYVIRHKGAPHLRGAARNLTWYQEALLDVFAVVFLCLAAALYVAWTVVRTLLRLVMRVGCSLTGACDQKAAPKKKKQ